MHRIELLGAAAGCITELSLAEYGKVIIFIHVLKSLNICSKSKTENINLEPSLTHNFSWCLSFLSFSSVFSGLSSLIFFLFNPKQWITYVLATMLGHFTYPYSSLKIYMLAIIASIILLKKKLWLRLCKIIGWMPAKISNSSFHSVKL